MIKNILRYTVSCRRNGVKPCQMKNASENQIQNCLGYMWEQKERKFGTINVRFSTEEARCHSATTLKPAIAANIAKVRVLNMPPEISITRLVAAIWAGLEEEDVIILDV